MTKSTKSTGRSTATPGVTKLGQDRFLARYRGPDHRERTKVFTTIRDAKNWRESESAKVTSGDWVDPVLKRTSFRAFAEPWIERRGTRAERTTELYRHLLTRHILPTFGDRPIGAIRPSAVEEWHGELSQRHASTAAKAYRLLSQIMRAAIADGFIAKSPCNIKGGGDEPVVERPTASIAEADALADALPERLRLIVHLALWAQLRRGELLGLRRGNVDLLHGTLTVAATRVKMMSGEMVDKAPKSSAGVRTLAVPPHVTPLLVAHLEHFVDADGDALIFTGSLGEPLRVRSLDTAWQKARASIGRKDLHFHDLRHSGLTLAAVTGATIKELMQRAGHADERAAMRYQHVALNRDRVLADALSALVTPAPVISISSVSRP
jgi:integrase